MAANRRWGWSRAWPGGVMTGPRRGRPSGAMAILVLVLLLPGGWREAQGQGRPPVGALQATALADLRFGTVLPGIATRIPPDSPRGAGLFEIQGQRHMSVSVDLTLPVEMLSPAGDRLPLAFGPGDALAATNRGLRTGVGFDPNAPLIATLGPNGRLYVRLGGTTTPARLQVSATYRATITLTVANLGN